MPIISTFEQISREEGLQQGRQEGMQKGLQKGMQKGKLEGKAEACRLLLEERFASIPTWVDEKLAAADGETIGRWIKRTLHAERLEDVFTANGSHPASL